MNLNNLLTDDETLDHAYDIFLQLAADNLDPADILLFNLQFEERGAVELFDPSDDWQQYVEVAVDPQSYAEVLVGLADTSEAPINDVFARILICRDREQKFCHILWKE